MTIAVAIRTGSSVVFAADSKLTTQGIVGIEEDGSPRWQTQTYDHAIKVVHDRNELLMAMIAGHANIGTVSASDFISSHSFPRAQALPEQDGNIQELASSMAQVKRSHWETTQVEPDKWPGPILLLASPSPDGRTPRVWRIEMGGAAFTAEEILREPGIRLEGAYNEVFTLLYGYHPEVLESVSRFLELPDGRMIEALGNVRVLRPIDKVSLYAMPIQDAMDLAVFLATVQVQMDRFLPGVPLCGGPIDVMVLQMGPAPKISSYPGKMLHHP